MEVDSPVGGGFWYQNAETRSLILRYAAWLGGLNLVWETAHLPLYMVWHEGTAAYLTFTVVHCTLGDVMIGVFSLVPALLFARREIALKRWRWRRTAALTAAFGTAYTAFSEWMNVEIKRTWAYSELMPTLEVWGIETGLSPLLQWILLPPLALYFGRRTAGRDRKRP